MRKPTTLKECGNVKSTGLDKCAPQVEKPRSEIDSAVYQLQLAVEAYAQLYELLHERIQDILRQEPEDGGNPKDTGCYGHTCNLAHRIDGSRINLESLNEKMQDLIDLIEL